jgi:ClpP class serine protease
MRDVHGLLAAVRAQPWAILPEYLEAIEAIAARALDAEVLARLSADGHKEQFTASREMVAAGGQRLDGAMYAVVRDGVAALPLIGPIFPRANLVSSSAGGAPLDALMRDFRVAMASPKVDRVVFVTDSPGGVVSGLGEAADIIGAAEKPVAAYVTGMAASAAYWLISQADEIVVDRAASVGSIGVVATQNRQEAPGSDGRRSYEVVSSNAPLKRPDASTEEGRAALQAEVDAIEQVFIADVARGRKVGVAQVRSDFGRGGMVAAKTAIAAGMADRIGTLDGVLSEGRRAGSTNEKRYRRATADALVSTRRRAAYQGA